jgi:hypothetical protein
MDDGFVAVLEGPPEAGRQTGGVVVANDNAHWPHELPVAYPDVDSTERNVLLRTGHLNLLRLERDDRYQSRLQKESGHARSAIRRLAEIKPSGHPTQ